jgi:hypothetical protein
MCIFYESFCKVSFKSVTVTCTPFNRYHMVRPARVKCRSERFRFCYCNIHCSQTLCVVVNTDGLLHEWTVLVKLYMKINLHICLFKTLYMLRFKCNFLAIDKWYIYMNTIAIYQTVHIMCMFKAHSIKCTCTTHDNTYIVILHTHVSTYAM